MSLHAFTVAIPRIPHPDRSKLMSPNDRGSPLTSLPAEDLSPTPAEEPFLLPSRLYLSAVFRVRPTLRAKPNLRPARLNTSVSPTSRFRVALDLTTAQPGTLPRSNHPKLIHLALLSQNRDGNPSYRCPRIQCPRRGEDRKRLGASQRRNPPRRPSRNHRRPGPRSAGERCARTRRHLVRVLRSLTIL